MTDLLERLRAKRGLTVTRIEPDGTETPAGHGTTSIPINPDGPEAAAHIDHQAATIARLREAMRKIARIKDAAGDGSKFGFGGLSRAHIIARTALKED